MKTLRSFLLAGLATLVIDVVPLQLIAADIIWTNTTGGNWSTAANWSPNQVPVGSDNAFVTNNGTYTVTLDAAATVNTFTLGGESGIQTFTNSSQTLTLNAASTVGSNGVFGLSGGALDGSGPLVVNGPLIWTGGGFSGAGLVTASSTLTMSGGNAKTLTGRTLVNAGQATWSEGQFRAQSGSVLSNAASGTFDITFDAVAVWAGGGGAGRTIANAGLFRKTGGTGTATFNDHTFNNSGTVEVQSGTLSLSGNYAPTSASTHRFAVGGYAAGTGFGRLQVSGTLTLAGRLDLMLTNGFAPTNNATFAIITTASRNSTFSSVTGRGIGGGLYFNPTYLAGGVTLTVADGTPSFDASLSSVVDGKFQLRLNGVANETYRIDASTNLISWSAISTNAIPGSGFLDFIEPDSPDFRYRFYRAAFLP